MTLRQTWAAQCDAGDCDAQVIFDRIPFGERADYGMALNDAGWDARPGRDTVYCGLHWSIQARIDASSLGTPDAVAARATVSDEFAAEVVRRATLVDSPDPADLPEMPPN